MNKVLSIKGISKSYAPHSIKAMRDKAYKDMKTIHAVRDVSFEIGEGEIYGLLGPNGAGKSTIIKMITGLIEKDAGSIEVDGHDVDRERQTASKMIGAIIEAPAMFKGMTALDNLRYFAMLEGDVDENRIRESLDIVGLSDRAGDKVQTYSLGMKQRLGIAQAIMGRPKLLVLDEPTNGLDPEWIINIRELVKKLAHEEGVSVLVCSHILSEMQELCDRVGIIYKGELIKETNVSDIDSIDMSSTTIACFTTSDALSTYNILSDVYPKVIVKDNKVYVELIEEDIPRANKLLVEKDIDVYGIETKKRTLEDLFRSLVAMKNKSEEVSDNAR